MAEYPPLGHVVGIVGTGPLTKNTSKGEIVTFSVAQTDAYGTPQGDGKFAGGKTTWFNVAVWDADMQHKVRDMIYKGARVAIEGPIKTQVLDNGTESRDISAFKIGLVSWIPKGGSQPAPKPPVVADDDGF